MSARISLLSALIVALLGACSSAPPKKVEEPTLASIPDPALDLKIEKLSGGSTDQAVDLYSKLVGSSKQPAVRAEALRRLADITLRNAEQRMLAESDNATDQLSAAQQTATFQHSVDLYLQLLHEFPDYKDRSGVQYQLAKAYDLMAERQASLNALAALTTDFPADSQFSEAQFRRAEAAFVERNWSGAEASYSAVMEHGSTDSFYEQAVYKRGWSRFKQTRYEMALDDFFLLIERLQKRAEADRQLQALYSDAYRVTALSFSYMDGAHSIEQWFVDHGHKVYEPEVYRSLANLYLQQERYKDAADTYRTFVDNNIFHDEAPIFDTAVIETYQKGGFPSLVLPAKERFAEHYGHNSDYWKQARGNAIENLLPALKSHIKDLAQHYHAKAQQSKTVDDFHVAAHWYREFLDTFPNDVETPGLHFLMAEALYDANDLQLAANEYEHVAYAYPQHDKSEKAAYSALITYQQILKPQEEIAKKSSDPAAATLALKPLYLSAINSAQQYVGHFGGDAKAANVQASLVSWLFVQNDLVAVVAAARQLAAMPQASDVQKREARILVANGEFDLAHYDAAETAFSDAIAIGGLDAKTSAAFHERRAIAVYKQGEAAQQSGDKKQAVAQYLRLAELEPNATVRANAEYDAAAMLLELEDWRAAIAVLEKFRTQFPTNKLAAGVPEKLAFAYEKSEQWGRAAEEYVRLSISNADVSLQRDLLWHGAELYEKAEQSDKATQVYRQYLTRYPSPYAPAQHARMALLRIANKNHDTDKIDPLRRELVKAHEQEKGEKPGDITYAVADAAFALAEPQFVTFDKIALKLPLNKTLKVKRDTMQSALKSYEVVASYGVAEFTTAANFRIGQLYQHLAKDLMASERPKGLDQDAMDEYNVLLEEQSTPFEDRAITFFETNLGFSKSGIYNVWIPQSLAALAQLNPARYGKTEYVESAFQ